MSRRTVLITALSLLVAASLVIFVLESRFSRAHYLCTICAAREDRTCFGDSTLQTQFLPTPMSNMLTTRGIIPPHAHRWELLNDNGGFVFTRSCGLGTASNRLEVAYAPEKISLIHSLDDAGNRAGAIDLLTALLDTNRHRPATQAIENSDPSFKPQPPADFAAWWSAHGPAITAAER